MANTTKAAQYFASIPVEHRQPDEITELAAIITASPEGIGIDVKNGDGTNCKPLTQFLEQTIGRVETKQMKKQGKGDRPGNTARLTRTA